MDAHLKDGDDSDGSANYTKTIEAHERLCQERCRENSECNYWTYFYLDRSCYLKTYLKGRTSNVNVISGPPVCRAIDKRATPYSKRKID